MARRIGELLVLRGVLGGDEVERAAQEARAQGTPLLSYLLHTGADEGALAGALAERHRMPGVDLSRSTFALDAVGQVPRAVAETDLILPMSLEGGRLHLAMSHPLDERVISEVRFVTGLEVSPYAAVRSALAEAITAGYDGHARGEVLWRGRRGPPTPHIEVLIPPPPEGEDDAIEIVDDADFAEVEPVAEVAIEVGAPEPVPLRSDGRPLALVVDDEPEIRQLVQRMLESRGYAVETAADGEQALAIAEAVVPDVVLLDAMLPKVHGFEACKRLKSSPRTRYVPVVMMTAIYRGWRFAQDARENYGAEDYVEKPFRLDDLFRRVEAVREASAAKQEVTAAEPLVKRARELLAAGDLAGAADTLGEAVRKDPYAAEAHFLLGRTLRAKGDAFGAMTSLEHAAELRPNHLAALRTLSAVYEEKGFRRKAAEAMERALAAAPEQAREAIRADLLRLLQ